MKKTDRRSFLKSLGLLGAAFAAGCNRSENAKPPNFVFILVDDMGYGDAACYGNSYSETPNINRLASRGMRFTNAYAAAPNCSPARASILTGKWPARLGITQYLPGNKNAKKLKNKKLSQPELPEGLALAEVTIAEALKQAGYATASIGKWHLGGGQFLPTSQGFDFNFGGSEHGHHKSMFAPYEIPDIPDAHAGEYLTDRLSNEATDFIRNNQKSPFFLYLPHYAVHAPIQGKENLVAKYRNKPKPDPKKKEQFAAMLESVDDSVGAILGTLKELGLERNTVVFFFSDNGGPLNTGADNGPLRMGKGWLYEGGIREPLIVSWPGKIPAGSDSEELVSSVDFYPTILEMAGLAPDSHKPDGTSLTPILLENKKLKRDALYWHYPHYSNAGGPPCGAIRTGRYKLIEFFEDGRLELYDLEQDIGETNNVAAQFPEIRDTLYADLVAWRRSVNAQMPPLNPNYHS